MVPGLYSEMLERGPREEAESPGIVVPPRVIRGSLTEAACSAHTSQKSRFHYIYIFFRD